MKTKFYTFSFFLFFTGFSAFAQNSLNKTPEWKTSAEGILPGLLGTLPSQVNALYGYTVTGLGDINNDGYDDVAVSAPGMANVGYNKGLLRRPLFS
jgi:hypothetical protein